MNKPAMPFAYYFFILLCVINGFVVLGYLVTDDKSAFNGVPIPVLFEVLWIACARASFVGGRKKRAKYNKNENYTLMNDEDFQKILNHRLPFVDATLISVIPSNGETFHFYAPASLIITKNKSVGRTGGYGGASVRIAKGLTVHSGKTASKTIYADVSDTYAGEIALSNKRVVFLSPRHGFELSFNKITAFYLNGENLIIQAGSKNYELFLINSEQLKTAFDLIDEK